jgi:virulence-associated protein VapD
VLRLIRETEATFSVYLSLRQFQWAAPSVRELFMAQLSATTDLQLLKEQLRSIQESFLFAEYSSPEAGAYQL